MAVDLDPLRDAAFIDALRVAGYPSSADFCKPPDVLRDDLAPDAWMKLRNAQVRAAGRSAAEPDHSATLLSGAERAVAERLADKIFALAAADGAAGPRPAASTLPPAA